MSQPTSHLPPLTSHTTSRHISPPGKLHRRKSGVFIKTISSPTPHHPPPPSPPPLRQETTQEVAVRLSAVIFSTALLSIFLFTHYCPLLSLSQIVNIFITTIILALVICLLFYIISISNNCWSYKIRDTILQTVALCFYNLLLFCVNLRSHVTYRPPGPGYSIYNIIPPATNLFLTFWNNKCIKVKKHLYFLSLKVLDKFCI